MKKIMVVFGTRPEAIKMFPLIAELKKRQKFQLIICNTGQHLELTNDVLKIFNIVPNYDLEIMSKNQSLTEITGKILDRLTPIVAKEKPDIILVHGDTTTAFCAALVAFYQHIPIGHVEAGLRTYQKYAPYPEEINRQIITLLADYHFAPTKKSYQNLVKAQVAKENIFITGNTAIDALKYTIKEDYDFPFSSWLLNHKLILLTAHRRENLGENLVNIFKTVKKITDNFSDIRVIYPIHPNPRILKTAEEILGNNKQVKLIKSLEVIDFHNLMQRADLILTDSGGIQEEAPSLGKPVLVLRDTTERPEGIKAGTLRLVGTKPERIYDNVKRLLESKRLYQKMSKAKNPYGNGNASQKIADVLEKELT